jgi:hypothetical protein
MGSDLVPEPGIVAETEIDRSTPEPTDCLPPGEEPTAIASLSPGWIAATEREILAFRPDGGPPLVRIDRANATGLAVKRTGGRPFLGYVPGATLYAVAASAFGALLLSVSPRGLIAIPDAPGAGQLETIVRTIGWAMGLLGTVLVFTGILAGLIVVVVLVYWLLSREVALVVEREGADPIECPTTRAVGTRALGEIETALEE